jgi:hypothetical protein
VTKRLLLACLLAALAATAARAQVFVVPTMKQAPRIDGKIERDEWRLGTFIDGFGHDGTLVRRRATGWVAATQDTLYVAIRSELPYEGTLTAQVDRDGPKVVYDDAVEVFIDPTPEGPGHVSYRMLANSIGKVGYGVQTKGGAEEDAAWQGGWTHAGGFHDGKWHFECAIPLASMPCVKPGRRTTDGQWRINLTRDWKSPWEWSSMSGEGGALAFSGLVFRFTTEPVPAVLQFFEGVPFRGAFDIHLGIERSPGQAPEVTASLVLTRDNMPTLKEESRLKPDPTSGRLVTIRVPKDDPAKHYTLRARVTSADGTLLFDREVSWQRGEPWYWAARGDAATGRPIDFNFAYYPYTRRMRVVADINGLPKDAKLTHLRVAVRKAGEKEEVAVADFPLEKFKDGRQERVILDLSALDGDYEIALKAEGENVPDGEVVQTFERHVFPWEHTKLGTSTKVYPPFTPIEVDKKARTVKTVLRTHTLTDLGLLAQVEATSAQTGVTKPILAAPMRLVARIDGRLFDAVTNSPGALEIRKGGAGLRPEQAGTSRGYRAGPLVGVLSGTWDYDGCLKMILYFCGTEESKAVEDLTLEIPLRADVATMIHANADRIRAPVAQKLPPGEGIVWDSTKVACDDYLKNFCPYIYLGDAVRGLAWFAENDRGWSWDRKTPNLTVVRQGDQVILRVHLVNKPFVPKIITFGLLAAPVKPRLVDPGAGPNQWRYRFLRDKYALLGTDINWFGIGCGSVYPIGRDLALWEVLARGNREKLTDAQVQATIDRGMPFFKAHAPDDVETWKAHVHHNLRSHLGQKMVFYYNRASVQYAEEFETFKDEWCLEDLRSVGKGGGVGEIKIVPSASYIDHALYWYAKSFERGGNQGVYWDNFFIAPTFNTEMSDAYRDPDGTIVPAAGIWALRDLAKRTFVMMNERGMRPITFPHMTSFNPLPMMSFATVQYDWEWKYSEGDVQDRFTRDLILLMTTGDLAGVWPVPLGDAGKLADDPWTQRTFTAVRLVHELDGYGGFGSEWQKSHQASAKLAAPVLALLDEPALQVYRYWDERPQPVRADSPDTPTIVYVVPGRQAVAVATSYSPKDEQVTLTVDAKAMGFAGAVRATNTETGEPMALQGGRVRLALKKHDLVVLRFEPEGAQ